MNNAINEGETSLTMQADEWVERLKNEPDEQTQREFVEWMSRSPEHMDEYLAMAELDGLLAKIDPDRKYTVEDLCAKASSEVVSLSARTPGSHVEIWTEPLGDAEQLADRPIERSGSRRVLAAAAACALILIGGIVLWPRDQAPEWSDHHTAERPERFTMSDGSQVTLGLRSQVSVLVTEERRLVRMVKGNARFGVRHESRRPFDVMLNDTIVRAVGTEFEVVCEPGFSSLIVLGGKVQVIPADEDKAPEMVVAGERVQIDVRGGIERESALVAQEPNDQMLDLRGKTLGEVADLLNRTGQPPRFIVEGSAQQHKLALFLNANDRQGLIAYLQHLPDLSVVPNPREVHIRPADESTSTSNQTSAQR